MSTPSSSNNLPYIAPIPGFNLVSQDDENFKYNHVFEERHVTIHQASEAIEKEILELCTRYLLYLTHARLNIKYTVVLKKGETKEMCTDTVDCTFLIHRNYKHIMDDLKFHKRFIQIKLDDLEDEKHLTLEYIKSVDVTFLCKSFIDVSLLKI